MCIYEQRCQRMRHTVWLMQLEQANGAVAALWIVSAGLIGLLGNVASPSGAAIVLGFGLGPTLLLLLQWSHPVAATSIAVHQARP